MTNDKPTIFRVQDVKRTTRICHTPAELSDALKWLGEMEDHGRVLSSNVATSRYGPDAVDVTWLADVAGG